MIRFTFWCIRWIGSLRRPRGTSVNNRMIASKRVVGTTWSAHLRRIDYFEAIGNLLNWSRHLRIFNFFKINFHQKLVKKNGSKVTALWFLRSFNLSQISRWLSTILKKAVYDFVRLEAGLLRKSSNHFLK